MLNEMMLKLQNLIKPGVPFDPAKFNDPVALRTAWTPAKGGGTNFRTHKLVQVDLRRVEFRATVGNILFCSLFLIAGLGVGIGVVVYTIVHGRALDVEIAFPVLFGMIFAVVGGGLLYYTTRPIIFDAQRGFYWKGRKSPDDVPDRTAIKDFALFADLHAIQLVSERCSGKNSSYCSYELNLVLHDGKRLNVIDHGNRDKLRVDAATLSRFLGKPVWDAT